MAKAYIQILVFIVLALRAPVFAQRPLPQIDFSPVGQIITDGVINGTGFVFGSPKTVITCEHVIRNRQQIQFLANGGIIHNVKIVRADSVRDFAVLVSADTICRHPYFKISAKAPKTGDTIFYVGHNSDNVIVVNRAVNFNTLHGLTIVRANGQQYHCNGLVPFIEFEGLGKPGSSGGPIFNSNGEIVAILAQAWDQLDLKGISRVRINRGFLLTY